MERILVIGGARALGAAVARRAVNDGYDVVVGARDLAAADVLAREIGATALRVDLQDESTIAAAAERLSDGIDHLVTTGSAPHDVRATELDRDKLLAAFTAKVVGPMLVAKHFKVGGKYAWDASKRIGRLFESQTRALETLVGEESGMADFANDECEIDPALYAAFVDRLIAFHDSQNNVDKSLVRGYIAPALVLSERGGLTIPSLATSDVDWTAAARAIELSMPQ